MCRLQRRLTALQGWKVRLDVQYLAWALGSRKEASNGDKIVTAVVVEAWGGAAGESAQAQVRTQVEADVGALRGGIGTGLATAANCRGTSGGEVTPDPATWGKPGSAERAGERPELAPWGSLGLHRGQGEEGGGAFPAGRGAGPQAGFLAGGRRG